MPTFRFLRNGKKVYEQRGADANLLEENIKKWMVDDDEGEGVGVKGHVSNDYTTMILNIGIQKSCTCVAL
jgi:hypothetical protein